MNSRTNTAAPESARHSHSVALTEDQINRFRQFVFIVAGKYADEEIDWVDAVCDLALKGLSGPAERDATSIINGLLDSMDARDPNCLDVGLDVIRQRARAYLKNTAPQASQETATHAGALGSAAAVSEAGKGTGK